jgi:Pathogenicity locus
MKSDLLGIPGIGKTFVKDFARIGVTQIKDLERKSPERLFKKLEEVNRASGHKTSKNYLYGWLFIMQMEGGIIQSLLGQLGKMARSEGVHAYITTFHHPLIQVQGSMPRVAR